MACDQQNLIQAFYDGELSPQQAADVQHHLRTCPGCARELGELQRASGLLANAVMAQPSQMTMERLRRGLQRRQDLEVRRLAGWLTAAAAAVLVASLLISHEPQSPTTPIAAGPDVTPVEQLVLLASNDGSVPDSLIAARWMADDLASVGRVQP